MSYILHHGKYNEAASVLETGLLDQMTLYYDVPFGRVLSRDMVTLSGRPPNNSTFYRDTINVHI